MKQKWIVLCVALVSLCQTWAAENEKPAGGSVTGRVGASLRRLVQLPTNELDPHAKKATDSRWGVTLSGLTPDELVCLLFLNPDYR